MKRDNLTVVLAKFARELNIRIDTRNVYDELLIHPDYPSLLAVSDVLQNFNIENGAYHVNKDELTTVPFPFIAHTNINRGDFLLVHKVGTDTVTVSNEKWDRHKMSSKEFETRFAGVVLAADTAAGSTSLLLKTDFANLKAPVAAAALLLAFVTAVVFHTGYIAGLSWQVLMLTVVKTAGLAVSVLLLIQSFDSNNPLVQKFCQGGGKNNCNDILSSKAAKVFPNWLPEGLSWSEVGFFYFASTWLFLLFGGAPAPVMQILAVLNIISLPYTFYSIYYQARVAKKWCVLCCTVQALLWLEFIPLLAYLPVRRAGFSPLSPGEGWGEASVLFIAFVLPVALWVLAKPMLLQLQQVHPLKQQLQQFKYNSELFYNTLTAQPKYTQPDEEWSIVLGNAEAENIITMVSNPYCPPCAKTHKLLHDLLGQQPGLQARIVFTATNTDEDIKTPISRHMMTLNGLPDKAIVKQALYDWYEQKQKNYEAWAKAYPAELNETEYNKINKQKAWCELAEVIATPTMLLNGYRLPSVYQLTDLKYMLQ
jgi:uncharacterized membrane protein/glutaredoxin